MTFFGKQEILKNKIDACDYEFIIEKIDESLLKKKTLLISPIASQTLVRAYINKKTQLILKRFNYLLPDGQWVRYAINYLHKINLRERVYAVTLMRKICAYAMQKNKKIFLYGTTTKTLGKLKKRLEKIFPYIKIVGTEASKYRKLTKRETDNLIFNIINSKADIIFVALGSPLQEIFSYEILYKKLNKTWPTIIICMGSVFDIISQTKKQAPELMQKLGLESFFRLLQEPKRLWVRYLIYGPLFLILVILQKLGLVKNQ